MYSCRHESAYRNDMIMASEILEVMSELLTQLTHYCVALVSFEQGFK
jgi:hypothetical protein